MAVCVVCEWPHKELACYWNCSLVILYPFYNFHLVYFTSLWSNFPEMVTSEANHVPIPRKSPSPSPKFGDRVGTGKVFLDSSGKIRGLEELNSWGFSGINSPKIPKVWGGDKGNDFGENWGIPVFPQSQINVISSLLAFYCPIHLFCHF